MAFVVTRHTPVVTLDHLEGVMGPHAGQVDALHAGLATVRRSAAGHIQRRLLSTAFLPSPGLPPTPEVLQPPPPGVKDTYIEYLNCLIAQDSKIQ